MSDSKHLESDSLLENRLVENKKKGGRRRRGRKLEELPNPKVDESKEKVRTEELKAYEKVIDEFNVHKVNVKELTSALSHFVDLNNNWKSKGVGYHDDEEKGATVKGFLKMLKNIKFGETQMRKWMSAPPPVIDRKRVETLRVICWDLGNQNIEYLYERMSAVADFIEREKFDIVLLQKVNPLSARYLKVRLYEKYKFIPDRNLNPDALVDIKYTLTRYETLDFVSSKNIKFQETFKNCSVLRTQVEIGAETVHILNTRLASWKLNSERRINQFQECLLIFQHFPEDTSVVLGGNFNVRDYELEDLEIARELLIAWDIWVNFGEWKNTFTWDLRVNKLTPIPGCEAPTKPYKRFDRMYFRKSSVPVITPVFFDLCGKDIVAGGKYFVSDHFGIITEFQVNPDCYLDQTVLEDLSARNVEDVEEDKPEEWTVHSTKKKSRTTKNN